jgi:hypothetical protein
MTQDYNLTLVLGQLAYEFPYILPDLGFHQYIFHAGIGKLARVKQVRFIIIVRDCIYLLKPSEMVDNKIMGYTHYPGKELAVILVFSFFDRLYHLKEGILKNIFGKSLIADIQTDVRENLVLMPVD